MPNCIWCKCPTSREPEEHILLEGLGGEMRFSASGDRTKEAHLSWSSWSWRRDVKKRILLVEDNPATADMIQQELEFLGYEVMVAKSGENAVEMASSESPALIVMDIALPRMDGLQATARIRSNPKTRGIPILAATAKALPGDRERCLASGCDDYLAKPFTHRELGERIERLLKSR